jgi:hypothetical protein
MGLFRAARDTQGDDRFFRLKVMIFAVGGALGVAGMSSGRDWLVASGIAVLAVGIALRMLAARQRARQPDSDGERPDS